MTFSFTAPFQYTHGWRDIVNDVQQDVDQRAAATATQVVWSSQSPFTVLSGQTLEIKAVGSAPFLSAITPTTTGDDPDITYSGAGTISAVITRDSGQSTTIQVTSTGGSATVLTMQLRAVPVPVDHTVRVAFQDPASVSEFGLRTYPQDIPLATANDVAAVSEVVVAQYALRRPIVSLRIVAQDEQHLQQILSRTVSDRITIRNDELGLDAGFYVEQVSHTITRIDPDRPPIHALVLGCEKVRESPNDNPFTFDGTGAGFDDGYFEGIAADDPATVWVWDTQSEFDSNDFGT